MINCLVFDIETVPDVDGLDDLDDDGVAKAMFFRRLQESGTEFLPPYQHRIVAISVALRSRDEFRLWSLGTAESDEEELVSRFFDGLDRLTPDLVSWNGGGFDLPVLHYRALRHNVQARRYWEMGDEDRSFRYNNYLGRFHWRHVDLMDVISGYQPRARAPLDDIACMLGFPGKMGMKGDKVWGAYQAGEIGAIRDYCETDVLNTYLVYLKFQHMRAIIDAERLEAEYDRVRANLEGSDATHHRAFLEAWAD
jgi:predicted PolB exonuclease-like 3'-5' exonuclease